MNGDGASTAGNSKMATQFSLGSSSSDFAVLPTFLAPSTSKDFLSPGGRSGALVSERFTGDMNGDDASTAGRGKMPIRFYPAPIVDSSSSRGAADFAGLPTFFAPSTSRDSASTTRATATAAAANPLHVGSTTRAMPEYQDLLIELINCNALLLKTSKEFMDLLDKNSQLRSTIYCRRVRLLNRNPIDGAKTSEEFLDLLDKNSELRSTIYRLRVRLLNQNPIDGASDSSVKLLNPDEPI